MAAARTKGAKNKKNMVHDGSLGGFTIIEVVLVLAIAGLIFMMVFIALPQLQRAQRDTQRRQDMADLQAAVTQFQTNNNGKIPGQGLVASKLDGGANLPDTCPKDNTGDACRLIKTYMHSAGETENKFLDPDGEPYSLYINQTMPSSYEFDHKIYMFTNAGCEGEEAVQDKNKYNARDFVLVYRLEGSGTYCHSNND